MNKELEILLAYDLEVMQEDNFEELNTWYVYDHENNEVLHNEWFETEKEAQDYLDAFIYDNQKVQQ
jgi:hypothetical protein